MKIRCGFRLLVFVVFVLAGTVTVCYAPHYTTFDGRGSYDFGGIPPIPPIPAGFFSPGSDPFVGVVDFGSGDVITRGLEEMRFGNQLPSTATIPIELVELNLTSSEPITVMYGGQNPELWDVNVTLSDQLPPDGSMTVTKTHCNGGTFTSSLNVQPKFTFSKVSNPTDIRILDSNPPSRIVTSQAFSWVVESPKDNPPSDANGFYPASAVVMQGDGMLLELQPPGPVRVHFLLASEQDWRNALADGRVHPLPQADGEDYINQFNANMQEGDPYPATTFLEAQLYVLAAEEEDYSEEAGLLMVWDNGNLIVDVNYASAWQYTYPDDPDLTNTIITVTVDPPCGMSVVSLGMQDINGNIRAWYWNVAPIGSIPPYTP